MTAPVFISYAQNGEDVLLRRALKDVENGFYVDVGANDPMLDSVTCAFYQAGWRGINMEPLPETFKRLSAARPADINLNLAAGEVEGSIPFFLVKEADGLSTAAAAQAEALRAQGFESNEMIAQVRRLDAVMAEHVTGDVHFLKIDVEGFERAVLAGADFRAVRPWIILVEATKPNSQEPTHEEWEHLLTVADYRFVWFDGLNRFYIAAERPELAMAFQVQPNVFDRYLKYSEALTQAQLTAAKSRLAVVTASHKKTAAALRAAEEQLALMQQTFSVP